MREKFDVEIKIAEYEKDIKRHNIKCRAKMKFIQDETRARKNEIIFRTYPELEIKAKKSSKAHKRKMEKLETLRSGINRTKKEITEYNEAKDLIINDRTVSYPALIKKEITRLKNGDRGDKLYAQQLELEMEYIRAEEKERILLRIEEKLGSKMAGAFTLAQIAKTYDITRERVRQIEAQTNKIMKHPINKRKLQDYAEHDFRVKDRF